MAERNAGVKGNKQFDMQKFAKVSDDGKSQMYSFSMSSSSVGNPSNAGMFSGNGGGRIPNSKDGMPAQVNQISKDMDRMMGGIE